MSALPGMVDPLVPDLRFALAPRARLFELAGEAVERGFVGVAGGEHHADR